MESNYIYLISHSLIIINQKEQGHYKKKPLLSVLVCNISTIIYTGVKFVKFAIIDYQRFQIRFLTPDDVNINDDLPCHTDVNIEDDQNNNIFNELKDVRRKHPHSFQCAYLNINSFRNKYCSIRATK